MTYLDVNKMTPHQQEAFIAWLHEEFEDPKEIAAQKFAVHNGRVSGFKFLRNDEGDFVVNNAKMDRLRVPFNQVQRVPLPEGF